MKYLNPQPAHRTLNQHTQESYSPEGEADASVRLFYRVLLQGRKMLRIVLQCAALRKPSRL